MEKSTINAVWLHKYHKAMDNECFKKIFFVSFILSFGCKHQCGFHKFADFSDFIYSGLLHNTLYTVAWPLVSFDILQCGCLHRKPLWAREYWIKYTKLQKCMRVHSTWYILHISYCYFLGRKN